VRTETFNTPGPLTLDLRVPAGRVDVQAVDTNETVVEVEALRNNDSSIAAVEETRIEFRERAASGQEILVDVPSDHRGIALGGLRIGVVRSPEVLVRVSCPHGTRLQGETGSADFDAHGRFGSSKVSAASGDIDIEEVDGEATVSTASGDIDIGVIHERASVNTASGDIGIGRIGGDGEISIASGDVVVNEIEGSLNVNSASGDVVVRDAAASVTIKTASGDQRLERVAQGEVSLQSASGDIQVKVREGTRVWIDARSRSGDTTSELDVGDEPPAEEGPTLELRANSMSGDIHIGRAA
jgi:putative adhesin